MPGQRRTARRLVPRRLSDRGLMRRQRTRQPTRYALTGGWGRRVRGPRRRIQAGRPPGPRRGPEAGRLGRGRRAR